MTTRQGKGKRPALRSPTPSSSSDESSISSKENADPAPKKRPRIESLFGNYPSSQSKSKAVGSSQRRTFSKASKETNKGMKKDTKKTNAPPKSRSSLGVRVILLVLE